MVCGGSERQGDDNRWNADPSEHQKPSRADRSHIGIELAKPKFSLVM